MVVRASGFGAGTRELDDRPNVTQVILGDASAELPAGQPAVLLETNVDDATGEVLGEAIAALLRRGPRRLGHCGGGQEGPPCHCTVSALVDPALSGQVASAMVDATGTLGVRGQTLERWPQARMHEQVEVAGVPVRVKVSSGRVKVEHDDASRAARQSGLPYREVVSLAEEAWRRRGTESGDDEPPDVAGYA